jgi:hypothetical protein
MKPLLLIDVDGVLNPFGFWEPLPNEFVKYSIKVNDGRTFSVHLNAEHGKRLLDLSDRFELTWCTTWVHEANEKIGPKIGLPELPVVEWNNVQPQWAIGDLCWKTLDVIDYTVERPFVWLDGDIGEADVDYIGYKRGDNNFALAKTDAFVGLEDMHFESIERWYNDVLLKD